MLFLCTLKGLVSGASEPVSKTLRGSDNVTEIHKALATAVLPLSPTLLSILSASVINRVMVVELGLPVILAGLFLAIPLLLSPLRIWLGQLSDAYPSGTGAASPT